MKKFLLPLAACAVLFTGCSNDETVEVPQGQPIDFSGSFIDKISKAIDLVKGNSLRSCNVWGSSSASGAYIFDNQLVTLDQDGIGAYNGTRYWTPSTTYHFMAIATPWHATDGGTVWSQITPTGWTFTSPSPIPGNDHTGPFGSIQFNNNVATGARGLIDLCYASNDRTTDAEITSAPQPVELAFKHALSRIRFIFKNNMPEKHFLVIKNIKVSGIPEQGTLSFTSSAPTWDTSGTIDNYIMHINGGDSSDPSKSNKFSSSITTVTMFTLPTQTFTVSFDIDLFYNSGTEENPIYTQINEDGHPYNHTVTIDASKFPGITDQSPEADKMLQIGRAYAFECTIGKDNIDDNPLFPIEFTAGNDNWSSAGTIPVYNSDDAQTPGN